MNHVTNVRSKHAQNPLEKLSVKLKHRRTNWCIPPAYILLSENRKFLLNSIPMPTLFIVNPLKVDISVPSLANEPVSTWQVQSLSLRSPCLGQGCQGQERQEVCRAASEDQFCYFNIACLSNYPGFNDGGPWLHPKARTLSLSWQFLLQLLVQCRILFSPGEKFQVQTLHEVVSLYLSDPQWIICVLIPFLNFGLKSNAK